MKRPVLVLAGCLFHAALPALAAESVDERACNQQGREIALRVSEEVSDGLDASGRSRIAAIAEEVCLEFNGAGNAAGLPVVARPAQPAAAAPAQAAAGAQAPGAAAEAAGETEAEEDGGLFNLRIIDPEDRVQRPGLKRR